MHYSVRSVVRQLVVGERFKRGLAAFGWLTLAAATALSAGCTGGRSSSSAAGPAMPEDLQKSRLNLDEARRYVLELINRDRLDEGLEPVSYDEVAERAGQRHAEDMARHGFTAHWGSDGSVPEQRYSEAGGVHHAQENSACFFDGQPRELDPNPVFQRVELEQIQSAFINEVPPQDGHRKNILKPVHTGVGVGLAKAVGISQPCMAQEFVDEYGDYNELPAEVPYGATLTIAGRVQQPAEFAGVGLAYLGPEKAMSPKQLNATSSYGAPEPYVLYFREGYKTPKPVKMDGDRFYIEVEIGHQKARGRYEVSIWARYPDSGDSAVIVSLRTLKVR